PGPCLRHGGCRGAVHADPSSFRVELIHGPPSRRRVPAALTSRCSRAAPLDGAPVHINGLLSSVTAHRIIYVLFSRQYPPTCSNPEPPEPVACPPSGDICAADHRLQCPATAPGRAACAPWGARARPPRPGSCAHTARGCAGRRSAGTALQSRETTHFAVFSATAGRNACGRNPGCGSSGRLLRPFFDRAGLADLEQLFQVISQVLVAAAFLEQL